MKAFKNPFFTFILGILLFGGITMYAANEVFASSIKYKDTTVESALDDLYANGIGIGTNTPSIVKKYQSTFASINHTYNVLEDGKYLVVLKNSNSSCTNGNIATTGTIIIEDALKNSNGVSNIAIIDATTGDTITISGASQSSSYVGNAVIAKLDNINVSQIYDKQITNDTPATKTYTASNNNDSVLTVAVGNSTNRYAKATYTGKYLTTMLTDDAIQIDYVKLAAGSSITISAYGYNWGGGVVYIFD